MISVTTEQSEIYKNIMLCSLTINVIPKLHHFRSISNRFWDKCKIIKDIHIIIVHLLSYIDQYAININSTLV